jgi:predicted enzyme related to lactoylglutathione lyase
MPNPIVHWEIVSPTHGKELQTFYRDLFGWQVDTNNPFDYGLVDTLTDRGANGGIGPTTGPTRVTIYAEVDDLQAYLDKAVSLGGQVMMPVTEIPGAVTMAMFSDPAGNATGLIKSGPPPAAAEKPDDAAAPDGSEA